MSEEQVRAAPAGYRTVTPFLVVDDANAALQLYQSALGAELLVRLNTPDQSKVIYAEIRIGDTILCVVDEVQGEATERSPRSLGGTGCSLWTYVGDADERFEQAVAAGFEVLEPMQDAFWGDRMGKLRDPFGHVWVMAMRVKNLSAEEVAEAARQALEKRS